MLYFPTQQTKVFNNLNNIKCTHHVAEFWVMFLKKRRKKKGLRLCWVSNSTHRAQRQYTVVWSSVINV